jgi:hypothetical protein
MAKYQLTDCGGKENNHGEKIFIGALSNEGNEEN